MELLLNLIIRIPKYSSAGSQGRVRSLWDGYHLNKGMGYKSKKKKKKKKKNTIWGLALPLDKSSDSINIQLPPYGLHFPKCFFIL